MCEYSRNILEEIAVEMVLASMEYNGHEAEAREEVKKISDDDLLNFITEC